MERLDWNVENFTTAHVQEMEKYAKFEKKQVEEHYDALAANYEDLFLRVGYADPKKCQEVVSEFAE